MNASTLRRFSDAIMALYRCPSPADFARELLAAMRTLCGADEYVVNSVGPRSLGLCASSREYSEGEIAVFNSRLQEHPLIGIIEQAMSEGFRVGRWSEVTSLRQFQQTGLYHDFFRLTDTQHQLATTIHVEGDFALGMAFGRRQSRSDFQPEDAQMLELMLPHVQMALRNLLGRMEIENALLLRELAIGGQAVLVVDENEAPLFVSDRGKEVLREHFGHEQEHELPASLVSWLKSRPTPGTTLVCQNGSKRLWCVCRRVASWTPDFVRLLESDRTHVNVRCLHLRQTDDVQTALLFQKLGLTPREAEVLYWMLQGKRNQEIGIILGASVRTIDKHRDNLFAKLHVDNRASAVATAWEFLNSNRG